MNATKGYCTLEYGQLHYRMTARNGRRPLLLLHQTPSSSVMFEPLLAALADDFWCIAPDTPGFGQSDPLPERATIQGYAAAIAAFLHSLEVGSCFLFGHHTGAAIAVQFAFDYPASAPRVALSGPPLLTRTQIAQLKQTLPDAPIDEAGRFLTDLWHGLRHKNADGPLELTLREMTAALQGRDSYHDAYHAVFAHDFRRQLAALPCPVLLLAGEGDSLRASLEPARQLVRDGRVSIVPGANSYVCDQAPEHVAQLLRDFFM